MFDEPVDENFLDWIEQGGGSEQPFIDSHCHLDFLLDRYAVTSVPAFVASLYPAWSVDWSARRSDFHLFGAFKLLGHIVS